MELQKVFKKTLFGGFSKKDVLNYIDELNEQAKKSETELNEQIKALYESNEHLETQVAEFKAVMSELENQLSAEKQKTNTQTNNIFELNAEINRQKKSIESREREIELQMEKNKQLSSQSADFELHKQKYDQAAAVIGDAVLHATARAEDIVGEANLKADVITSGAKKSAVQISDQIISVKSDIDSLKENIKSVTATLEDKINAIYQVIEQTQNDMQEIDKVTVINEVKDLNEEFFRIAANR